MKPAVRRVRAAHAVTRASSASASTTPRRTTSSWRNAAGIWPNSQIKDKKTGQVLETLMEKPLPAMIPRP